MPMSTLTSKGQTVIPKSIRDQMGLKPGDMIDFVVTDVGDVLLRPAVKDVRLLKGMLFRPERQTVNVEEMNQVIKNRNEGRR